MAKVVAKRKSVNEEIYKIVRKYKESASKSEMKFDTITPALISLISVVLIVLFYKQDLLELVLDINVSSLTILSILAGFNTASLAVFSSSNPSEFVKKLSTDQEKEEGSQLLTAFISFFAYAILIQLFLLIIGLVGFVLIGLVDADSLFKNIWFLIPFSFVIFIWFSIILHSLFITIRNVSMLYKFIQFLGKG